MKFRNYMKRLNGNWIRRPGSELNRLCEEQRINKISHGKGFHYRRSSMTDTYYYWQDAGNSRKEAYEKAQITQLLGLKPCAINLDARTTIFPVITKR